MVIEEFYINQDPKKAMEVTGLAPDELLGLVGKFRKGHFREGMLRGKLEVMASGKVVIRHHLTKKVLWESDNEKLY